RASSAAEKKLPLARTEKNGFRMPEKNGFRISDFGFRVFRVLALLAALAGIGFAQRLDPVKWSFSVEPASVAPGSRVIGRLTATIEPGWHLYALATPPPSPASKIQLPENSISDKLTVYYREPKRAFDNT